ncbi:MAG: OB-fold domain-containing protein [Chloroflexi bacterium]|nr:OB-fold domain-containing protein [Chloroflexota bacterium]
MTVTEYAKPLPAPLHRELTKPFWEAAQRHELIIPRCKRCGEFFWYPRELCPHCLSFDWEWQRVQGKGRVYTFTIVRQPQYPAFNADVPYVFAIIQLNEGIRMVSNVVGCPVEEVKVDMPVEVTFDDVTPECTLFKFKPAS